MSTPPASASTFTVTTTNDSSGGVCTTNPATNVACTLRAAVKAANALGGANAIIVPAGSYVLSQSDGCSFLNASVTSLCITGNLTIFGAGPEQTIIDGNALGQIFVVTGAGTTVALNGITVKNGQSTQLGFGGGIYNSATLSLTDSTIVNNSSHSGGGIYNDQGTLTLTNCGVTGNFGDDGGGGIFNNVGAVTFANSSMNANTTNAGGAAAVNMGGTFTVTGSTISGNTAAGIGGAFQNMGGASAFVIHNAILTLLNSTLSGNTSGSSGGAISNGFNSNFVSEVNLNNVTISNNTIGGNRGSGGGIFNNAGTVNLKNTILAGNRDPSSGSDDCSTSPSPPGLNSQGYNLIGNPAGCEIDGITTGNIIGRDPRLGVLENNGGPTLTMALLPGSPAIDAGSPAAPGSTGNACAITDQRGLFRPFGLACDIGAFETFGVLSVLGALPNSAGNGGSVVAVVSGSGFASGAMVRLRRQGQPDIIGNPVSVDPGGSAIGTNFDLTNAALGLWDVIVINPDGTSASSPGGFTVATAQAPQLWVDLVGPRLVRAGASTMATYFLLIGNRGTVDAAGVTVGLSIPQNFGLTPEFPIGPPPPQMGQVTTDWSQAPIGVQPDAQGFTAYPLFLPVVPAGFTVALPVQLLLPALQQGATYSLIAGIDQPFFNPTLDPQVISTMLAGAVTYAQDNLGVTIPSSLIPSLTQYLTNQLQNAVTAGRTAFVGSLARQFQPYSLNQMLIDLAQFGAATATTGKTTPRGSVLAMNHQLSLDPGAGDTSLVCCNGQPLGAGQSCSPDSPPCPPPSPSPPPKPLSPADCADMAGFEFVGGRCVPIACRSGGLSGACAPATGGAVGSLDPNDKVGAQGVGSSHYVNGSTPFRYEISFANQATATAPAQLVVVMDQLNAALLDLSTFSLGLISFGSVTLFPPPGSSHFVGGVDLTPLGQNVFASVEANLDKSSGLLTWRFTSLDPATLQLTQNPLGGFLPPDTNPPNGEGKVLFTVQPKAGLATGSQIQNQAQVVFDLNPPINTPLWTNTIDVTPPMSRVSGLPPTETSASFLVQWTGTDIGSGIQDFTTYVSDNGGPFIPWLTQTTLTQATYNGSIGHTYGFYSLARDQVGNVENAKSAAEATTTVTGQPSCAIDATNQFKITQSGFRFNNATQQFVQTVTLQQLTLTPVQLPISLVLDDLGPNAILVNRTGVTSCASPLGSPYIDVNGTSVTLEFADPSQAGITYKTRILEGIGTR